MYMYCCTAIIGNTGKDRALVKYGMLSQWNECSTAIQKMRQPLSTKMKWSFRYPISKAAHLFPLLRELKSLFSNQSATCLKKRPSLSPMRWIETVLGQSLPTTNSGNVPVLQFLKNRHNKDTCFLPMDYAIYKRHTEWERHLGTPRVPPERNK